MSAKARSLEKNKKFGFVYFFTDEVQLFANIIGMIEGPVAERKIDPDFIKAILLDLDGTLIPAEKFAMPSEELRMVLQEAKIKKGMRYSIVTGRPAWLAMAQIRALDVEDPCVVNGGCEIINPITGEVLLSQPMTVQSQQEALAVCKDFKIPIYDSRNQYLEASIRRPLKHNWKIRDDNPKLFVEGLDHLTASRLAGELNQIEDLAALTSASFNGEDYSDIHITHVRGTKASGVMTLIDMLNLTPEQVMAFGDGHNDMPLFDAVSLSVAMGNAPKPVREAADFVASPQEQGGVEKFLRSHILSPAGITVDRVNE